MRLSLSLTLLICGLIMMGCAVTRYVARNNSDLLTHRDVLIENRVSLGEKEEISVVCDKAFSIKRSEYIINCDSEHKIDGEKYYLSSKCIEISNKEILQLPSELHLFDLDYKVLSQANGRYQPTSNSIKVRFGSKKLGLYRCIHSKVFYINSNDLILPKGKGIIVPPDCVVVKENGDIVMPEGYYYSRTNANEERVKIACTQKKTIEIQIVPVVELPKDYTLSFKKDGMLADGLIICDGLNIKAGKRQLFDNVILVGTLENKALIVEWFGCATDKDEQHNTEILKQYVMPSAIACGSDIFHSSKGIYRISGAYPVHNDLWGFDHSYIRDFKSITIYGTGSSTIIMECPIRKETPSDVFLIVDTKNLSIKNLSVTHLATSSLIKNGSNAFSLIHSNDNIHIENCRVYDMPYVEGTRYPDGGKAFTIQAGPNTMQRNLTIVNNSAEDVSYGADYTKTTYSEGDVMQNIVFENNVIKRAIVGINVHEWNSPYGEAVNPVIVNENLISECQIGVLCQTTKSCTITNNVIQNRIRPSRLRYYQGVYGIHTLGAYNTTIEGNNLNMKDCDAFMNLNVYSYHPRFNGAVRNMTVRGNRMRGRNLDTSVRIGKDSMSVAESRMLEDIKVFDNSIRQTGRR